MEVVFIVATATDVRCRQCTFGQWRVGSHRSEIPQISRLYTNIVGAVSIVKGGLFKPASGEKTIRLRRFSCKILHLGVILGLHPYTGRYVSSATPTTSVYGSQRLQARQQRILEVVRQEIAARGFDGVTMNDLAAKAGVVKKTLYNLYGGKDELLLAAVGEVIGAYRRLPDDVEPGIAAIIESRRIAVATVAAHPAYAVAMLQSLLRVSPQHELVDVLLRGAVAFTEEHLRHEVARGRVSAALDCNDFAHNIVAQGFGVIVLLAQGLVDAEDVPRTSMRGLVSLVTGEASDPLAKWLADKACETNDRAGAWPATSED